MVKSDMKLRVAHVAPLFASVPPTKYGGTERVLDWLIEEQVKMGLDVTLFASGDSVTRANLIPVIPKAIWHESDITFPDVYHTIELDVVSERASDFDVIHCHFDYIHYQSLHRIKPPLLTTLHWRVDLREFQDLYHHFNEAPLVAISHSQKSFIPQANVISVIHHGLPVERYPFGEEGKGYMAFLGRFSPEKGVHIALELAHDLGFPIKIASPMPLNESDQCYYDEKVKPLMDSSLVEYVGELDEVNKVDFLKDATVTIVPTNWPEPFGLVTAESLCCGTPVVVFPVGGTKEIVENGKVGFAVESERNMVDAVKNIEKISRKACRKHIVDNFSSSIMANKYKKVYKKLVQG